MNSVILYYCFARIEEVKFFWAQHRRQCRALDLKGRVYIAPEGINGTLAGTKVNIDAYKKFLQSIPGFAETQFKEESTPTIPFVKLIVRQRPEIVTLKSDVPIDPTMEKGKYLSPRQWLEALESKEEFTLLDVRNNYESRIGHFAGAIQPDVENFYDFPQWLSKVDLDKNKKVLMYCTGGIRCEKFSLYMQKKGFTKVYQLHGGIINYAQSVGDAHYQGKCFVFDDRLSVPVEEKQREPLTCCEITGVPCDQYLNCANLACNKLFICSTAGAHTFEGCCSEECLKAAKRRPFDPGDIYSPTKKWYRYQQTAINQ